ncbi:MAG: hypothetical protein NWE76_07900 [Candidatus Bathyarchaeota archaeon]|nr:hypothetical protein [Candidatus Bathyarchaeota archaeon]
MSTTPTVEKLRKEQKKIEDALEELEDHKKKVDEKYASVLAEENKLHEDFRKCRDTYEYSQLEIRLNRVSRRRREIETEKQATDRKIIGYNEELKKVKARIEYMKPKRGKLVSYKQEQ